MQIAARSRWLLVLAAFAGMALAAWLGRAQFESWTRARLAVQYQRQLSQLSDERAARLIERLASADDEYLDLVVLALADPRPAVAAAAERGLDARVERWSHWPAREASPRVAVLADLLAQSAEQIPTARRGFTQRIAQRLLAWPVDGQLVEAQQVIANCEKLLRLPQPAWNELRLAARTEPAVESRETTLLEATPAAPTPLPLGSQLEAPLPEVSSPRVVFPRQPDSLPDASREKPSEPRQFIAPRAIRISDDE